MDPADGGNSDSESPIWKETAERLAQAKEEARMERERGVAAEEDVTGVWLNQMKKSFESEGRVDQIYSGFISLVAISGLLGILVFLGGSNAGDEILAGVGCYSFCNAVIVYFSVTYFYHMWKNISINTSLSNQIQFARYVSESKEEE
tara:strand:- start:178 stop:618 length:441 start_codon:yes stop_codon:yes gene_type:complete